MVAVLVYGLVIPSAATAQYATASSRVISPAVQQPMFAWDDNSGDLPGYDTGNVLLIGAAVVAVVVVVYLVTKGNKNENKLRATTPMASRGGTGLHIHRTAPPGAPTSREASPPFRADARLTRPFLGVTRQGVSGAGASVVFGLSVPIR
jgi:hypothetical protein